MRINFHIQRIYFKDVVAELVSYCKVFILMQGELLFNSEALLMTTMKCNVKGIQQEECRMLEVFIGAPK